VTLSKWKELSAPQFLSLKREKNNAQFCWIIVIVSNVEQALKCNVGTIILDPRMMGSSNWPGLDYMPIFSGQVNRN
jgi:hypothetical protein